MTTSWAHFVRGEWLSAMSSSVAGTMLALVSAAVGPWAIATASYGKWLWIRPTETLLLAFCLTILTVTLAEWMTRLGIEHFLRS